MKIANRENSGIRVRLNALNTGSAVAVVVCVVWVADVVAHVDVLVSIIAANANSIASPVPIKRKSKYMQCTCDAHAHTYRERERQSILGYLYMIMFASRLACALYQDSNYSQHQVIFKAPVNRNISILIALYAEFLILFCLIVLIFDFIHFNHSNFNHSNFIYNIVNCFSQISLFCYTNLII